MAQLTNCFPSSDFLACNPRAGTVETAGSPELAVSQSSLIGEPRSQQESSSPQIRWRVMDKAQRHPLPTSGLYMPVRTSHGQRLTSCSRKGPLSFAARQLLCPLSRTGGSTVPGLVNAVEYCLQLLSHLCPCLLPSLYTPRGPFLSPCLLPSLRRRYLKETNPESAWILSCLFGVFRLQLLFGKESPKAALTPLWGQTCSINSLLRPAIFYL